MNKNDLNKKKEVLISFSNNDIIVDTILSNNNTNFIVFDRKSNTSSIKSTFNLNWKEYKTIDWNSTFLTSWSILFPSELLDYWNQTELLKDINIYLYKYMDVPEDFRVISCYYVLLTYLYQNFSEIPYLRVIWDYGSWKSRLLKTIWSICYNPMITNWWTSLSAIFRMIEKFKGTLVIDEADMSYSDTNNEMIKLFNNWYQKGNPIMRADWEWFEPRCYEVYCPKLIGWRMEFRDKATESRCLTNIMNRSIREDLPIWLDDSFYEEWLILRNKLLKFKLDNFYNVELKNNLIKWIEPRLNQIINPILSLVETKKVEDLIIENIKRKQSDIKIERKNSLLWAILWILLIRFKWKNEVYYIDILNDLEDIEGRFNFTTRKLWSLLKQNWLKWHRKNNWTVIQFDENINELTRLYEEYSILN